MAGWRRWAIVTTMTLAACSPKRDARHADASPDDVSRQDERGSVDGRERGMELDTSGGAGGVSAALNHAVKRYGRRIAVTVGVNAYQPPLSPLEAAVGDARRMGQLFRDMGFDDVQTAENATRGEIIDLLERRVPADTEPGDLVVVFFAGHGATVGDQGYILPKDATANIAATGLSVQQLKETALRMKARHVLYLVDACFSGSMFRKGDAGADTNAMAFWEAAADQRLVQIITAGGAQEKVLETGGWGSFTRVLHDGLEGPADLNRDGVVTTHELASFVDEGVRRDTKGAQHPQWGAVDGSGTVLLWDARKVPADARPAKPQHRVMIAGLESELGRIHGAMDHKNWADAEKGIRDLLLARSDVELHLLLAEVYLNADPLGNSSLIETELKAVEKGGPSMDEQRRELDLKARLEKAKRGAM